MQWMAGTEASYVFVHIASCPESGESALEPTALAYLIGPPLAK